MAPDSGATDTWGTWRDGRVHLDIAAALQPHPWWVSTHCCWSFYHEHPKSGFSHKKQTFENTTPLAISNCCKVQTHLSHHATKENDTKPSKITLKQCLWAAKPRWTCEPQALFVLSCSDLVCAARDPSHSQHHLNSGVSVCKCIIQSPAKRLEGTNSGTQRSSEPAGS